MSAGADPGDALILDVLGSGCGNPSAARDTSSLLVGAAGTWTLIDCPGSLAHKLANRGLDPGSISRIILTHDHVDHIYGLPHLLHARAIAGATEPLPVFAPEQALATVSGMVELHGLSGPRYPALVLESVDMAAGIRLPIDGAQVRSTPAAHGRDTIAVRFDAAGASACYSADTGPSDGIAELAAGADLLLHDCGGLHRDRGRDDGPHASAREAGEAAARAGVSRLALMHLCSADEAALESCRMEAEAAFGGPTVLARDGERWIIGGERESG